MATWIRGGWLVDPVRGTVERLDVIVQGARVVRLLPPGEFLESGSQLDVINAFDRLVVPGLIDMHVHLREPGYEYNETIATGAKAGVAGGFVAVACMPNTHPVNDNPAITEFILGRAHEAELLRVHPVASITKGQKGESLTNFGDLRAAGAVAVSDDGRPVASNEIMRRAIESAKHFGLAVVSHCEDLSLSSGGVMHEGSVSTQIGFKGIPSASEEIVVQREISLARLTGCPVHIAHVSTSGSVQLIRRAKEEGLPVTAETAPHYFTLDHRAVMEYNTHAKMNPPLRTPEDVQAIKQGLAEDVIDVIATDHAPHSPLEKDVDFERAAFGIIGLETALPLTLNLVRDGILTLPDAIRKLSVSPASILGLDGGRLEEGGLADLAIVDVECEYILKAEDIHSKSRNSPFLGRILRGRNLLTMVEGRIVWERETDHFGR